MDTPPFQTQAPPPPFQLQSAVTQTVNTVSFDLPPYWSPSFSMVNLEYSSRCWIERKLGELPAVYPMQWRIYSAARHNRYSYPGLCSPYSLCTSFRPWYSEENSRFTLPSTFLFPFPMLQHYTKLLFAARKPLI